MSKLGTFIACAGLLACAGLFAGCAGPPAGPEPAKPPAATATATAETRAGAPGAAPIDPAKVEAATGLKPEVSDGVAKVSSPRTEKVEVDGWAMPPFMGLTSWAAFTPGEKPGVEAMVMGDLVLFEDEVSDAMSAALGGGLAVTALHNHFFHDNPRVMFMHIEGEGSVDALGKGVRAALDAVKAVRARSAKPQDRYGNAPLPAKSAIDAAKVEAAFGVKPAAKDGMAKVVIGRPATQAACGCKIGKTMGVNTWAAFAGTDADAVVDGDFAVTEDELQPVLRSLRASGIHVVAIHHHMVGEEPRTLFLHYWGRGPVEALAGQVKKALALTKTSG
ncbi:MAG: DUF1259 domain-containing protein [Polyangiaceae bacterium]